MKFIVGVFLILHGLVHILYGVQALKVWELTPGLKWPGDSWIFWKIASKKVIEIFASVFCFSASSLFIYSGIFHFATNDFPTKLLWLTCIISTVMFIVFWNGKIRKLDHQGFYGIVINAAIFVFSFLVSGIN